MRKMQFSHRVVTYVTVGFSLMLGTSLYASQSQESTPQSKLASARDPANTADAVKSVESGDFVAVDVEIIVRFHAVSAIPALKRQFTQVQDPILKLTLASGLIRLGEKDDSYWNYLAQSAEAAIASNVPNVLQHDKEGKLLQGPPPEVVPWAKEHGLSLNDAAEDALYKYPGAVLELGLVGDKRSIPLLRRALSVQNYEIVDEAARGLANLKDDASVPLIVAACQRAAPSPWSGQIASLLGYFDTPEAQAAFNKFSSAEAAKQVRERRAAGMSPFD